MTWLFTVLLFLLLPEIGWAHASLRGTDPAWGSRLQHLPPAIRLWFDEAIVPGVSTVRLLDRSQKVVHEGPLQLAEPERTAAAFGLGALEPGAYTVTWKVLSSVDGHVTRGIFAFAYVPPGFEAVLPMDLSGTPPVQEGWAWVLRALRVATTWAHLLALLAMTGACFVWLAVVAPAGAGGTGGGRRQPFPPTLAGLILRGVLVSILGGIVSLQLEWLEVSDAPWPETLQVMVFVPAIPVALGTRSSIGTFIRLALLTGIASLATRVKDRDPVAVPGMVVLGVAALASVAVASHTTAAGGWWGAIPDFLHLTAASLWAGGLLLLVRLTRPQETETPAGLPAIPLREAMRRFSPWGGGSVILLVLTGVVSGTVHLPAWAAFWRTLYGGTLAAKGALLVPLLLLALLNTLWCRGRLAEGPIPAPRLRSLLGRVWGWGEGRFRGRDWAIRGELLLVGVALLCAATLTQLPPPKDAGLGPPPPISLRGQAGEFALALTVTSPQGLLAPSRVALSALDVRGQAPPPGARLILRPEMVEREIGNLPITAAPRGNGLYDAEVFFSVLGRWDLQVIVRRKGREDAFARFALDVGEAGFAEVDPASQFGTRLSLRAAWSRATSRRDLLIGAGLALGGGVLVALAARRRRWPAAVPAVALLVAGGSFLWTSLAIQTTPASRRPNPIPSDAASFEAGRALFQEHCARCHGRDGKPRAHDLPATLRPLARMLDLAADRQAQRTDGDLFWWITRGGPGTPMPGFDEALSDEERWHLVNYIRSLGSRGSAGGAGAAPR